MTDDVPTVPPRRLVRSRTDRMLGGVCGGIGAYFGIDPVLVRLVFVILAFAGGGGLLAYIVAWIIIPEESTDGETAAAERAPGASPALAGMLLIGVGGILLVVQVVPGVSWRVIAPLVLIAGGVLLLAKRSS
ncbi:MAG: PspC domain-containing protein [Nitriliruptoraceae bacterium]